MVVALSYIAYRNFEAPIALRKVSRLYSSQTFSKLAIHSTCITFANYLLTIAGKRSSDPFSAVDSLRSSSL